MVGEKDFVLGMRGDGMQGAKMDLRAKELTRKYLDGRDELVYEN